jgi:hypothetical protein
MRLPVILLVVGTAAACGGQSPTAPSATFDAALEPGAASAFETSSPLELRSFTGRTTNALTGAGAGGVTIRIAEVGDVVADASGNFTVASEAADGRYRITVSGPGVVERQTSIVFPGQPATLPLIPTGFNTQAFDQFARSFGQPDVLERWVEAPALIVETSLLDRAASLDATGLPLDTLIASAEQQSEAAVNELVAQLTRALPLLTGGQFTAFGAVTAQTTAPGAAVQSLNLGAITVVRYPRGAGQCRGFGQVAPNSEYVAVAGRVGLELCTDALAAPVAAHELGHALGYGHVSGTASVAATVTVDVTEFDRQAAAIAYQRAPGNRAPDVDPETFTVNQPLRMPTSGGWVIAPVLP